MPANQPSRERGSGQRRAALLVGCVILPLALFAVLGWRVREQRPFAWDLHLQQWLHHQEGTLHLNHFSSLYFHVGEEGLVVFALVAIVLVALGRWGGLAFFAVVCACTFFLDDALKDFFHRAPLVGDAATRGYAFPSGHALGSMAVTAAIVCLARGHRRIAAVAGAIVVALIGTSVVVYGVHYPTDVLAGWCIGLALVTVLWAVFPRRARELRGRRLI